MKKNEYKKLDCRIRRRNKVTPCVFLIDATREPYLAAVFDPRTRESLDHRKVRSPRPLKTHAYNFSHIEDLEGEVLVERRALNSREAESFVQVLTQRARPITRNEYFAELESIVWPPPPEQGVGLPGGRRRAAPVSEMSRDPHLAVNRAEALPFMEMEPTLGFMISPGIKRTRLSYEEARERKAVIREIIHLLEMMDQDDLRLVLRFSRMLLEE